MKRKLLVGALGCICLSALAGGTLAYYTAENTAHNVITTGGIDIAVQEWADEDKTTPFPEDGVNDVMPGTAVTKIVEVQNTGANDAYIRIKVDKSITLAGEGEPDLDLLTLDFNDTDWTAGEEAALTRGLEEAYGESIVVCLGDLPEPTPEPTPPSTPAPSGTGGAGA